MGQYEEVFFQRRAWDMRHNHVFHNRFLERMIASEALTMIRRPLDSSSTLSWGTVGASLQDKSPRSDACRGHRINYSIAFGILYHNHPCTQKRHHDPRSRMFYVTQGSVSCDFSRRVCVFAFLLSYTFFDPIHHNLAIWIRLHPQFRSVGLCHD